MDGFNLSNISNIYVGNKEYSEIYLGSNKVWPLKPHDYSKDYFTIEIIEPGTIKFGSPYGVASRKVQYSTDGGTTWVNFWAQYSPKSLGTFNTGDKILIKGNNTNYTENGYHICFQGTSTYKVYGNIMSLLYGDDFVDKIEFPSNDSSVFDSLFYQSTGLIDASNLILPATTLTDKCYLYMFNSCSNLIAAPALPATSLATGCYSYMFSWCKNLVVAPTLPATELVSNCYNHLFSGCNKLNYIKAMFLTTPSTSYTDSWVYNVSDTGTFVKNAAATWDITGSIGVPEGWVVETA